MHYPVAHGLVRSLSAGLSIAALLAISGCAIKLVSSYDETTDKTVSALQKKTETHLVNLETLEGLPECVYSKPCKSLK